MANDTDTFTLWGKTYTVQEARTRYTECRDWIVKATGESPARVQRRIVGMMDGCQRTPADWLFSVYELADAVSDAMDTYEELGMAWFPGEDTGNYR